MLVFCLSAFLAGIGGILYGCSVHFASTGDSHFTSFQSLLLLAVLAVAPFAEPWYAIFMGVALVIPAYWTNVNAPYWLNAIFGFFAVVVSLQGQQPTVPLRLQAVVERFRRPSRLPESAGAVPPRKVAAGHGGLVVDKLRVRFGGLVAVDELTFEAPPGRITGLIGPNGAGKTTTFDACSGLNRRVGGSTRIHGRDVTRLGPAARGRLGLGRTFQRMQLGDSLTVAENVALGREAGLAGAAPWSQIVASPAQRRETLRATAHALELCGIADLAETQAGALSTGQRRLVELARCLAGDFDILMLDEPSSGLDRYETAAFAEVLLRVVEERGCGILLVEHDVALVMSICTYMYVLDFGSLIFEGTPAEVAASPVVRAAYLGSTAVTSIEAQEATL